ncbi:MAG: SDR family oxidoreductase [Ruminococcus sp.]|nr:SDR family oxidoreductase [Ruminococcus sp.]
MEYKDNMSKTALITGGSRGIGAAIALRLAKRGFLTVINYFSDNESAEKIVSQTGGFAMQADVSDMTQVENMIKTITEKTGGVDVLVNNAGISVSGLFTDITPEEEQRLWGINVGGVFNCTKCVIPYMINKKHGKIINISSMWGQVGASCEVHYSASKAAVIGFTKALAMELGPSGINVNCIAPGVIMTDMNACHTAETLEALKDETPLQRLGTAEDVAEAAAFLASEESSFITGQILGVNGGFVV